MMNQQIAKEVKSTYGSSVWKTIRNLWHDFCVNVETKVGMVKRLLLEDHWIGQNN